MNQMRVSKRISVFLLTLLVIISMVSVPAKSVEAAGSKIPSVSYAVHAQSYGWMKAAYNGKTAGTTGQGKRLEAIAIALNTNHTSLTGTLRYRVHSQSYGWMNWLEATNNGTSTTSAINSHRYAGTTGQGKRLEAIQMKLTGTLAQQYEVLYRVHMQTYGWSTWTRNGETAGTTGQGKRIEAIEIKLVRKTTANPSASVEYTVHAQSYGWMNTVSDGKTAGTTGQGKRLEAIRIKLRTNGISGGIVYNTHLQGYGWTKNEINNGISGTTGQGKRIEAICISLTGDITAYYDVYYRVHCQSYGWLGWTKNGQIAGTTGGSKRMEAIQIRLVKKGAAAPGSTDKPYVEIKPVVPTADTYVIRVNKQQSCVTVYQDGVPIKAMACSPGDSTPVGTYRLSNKWRWTSLMGGVQGQYVSQITENYLFHSVLYNKADPHTLIPSSYNNLGKRVSHGCVRLRVADAKWIFENCPSGTRIEIYESADPGPLGKPVLENIPGSQTWDPSDTFQ